MQTSDPLLDIKAGRHFRRRAVGQLWMGPIQKCGYDNRVLELTVNDLEFKTSNEASKYMDQLRRKYSSSYGLSRARKLKMVSSGDE